MANLALGIDTGGTFTDGVIWELDKRKILCKTKVVTTRHDLHLAIDNCLQGLLDQWPEGYDLKEIKMISLSTTLATNAIVEGQGAEVGLIQIGFAPDGPLPTPHHASIKGGCNVRGRITREVDLQEAKEAVKSLEGKVEAFAVSGYMSVRNPKQEIQVARLISEITGCPVVSGHQLSSDLGFRERTVTAVFNARLISLITNLIDAVRENIEARGINAPLMVVKGDGTLISEKVARERPVETLLSGPAASIIGAMALTGLEEGVVVDMGGTTTDIATLQEGRPALNYKGARVGGWMTRVKAADITTVGLGGDSLIKVSSSGDLSIGPQRVFPLAWAADKYPHLLEELEEIWEEIFFPLENQPTTILVHIKDPVNLELSPTETMLLELIKEKPHTLFHLSRLLKKDPEIIPWQRLVNVGSLHRASLTPTDLLHVSGEFNRWNTEAARIGIDIMARRMSRNSQDFVEAVLEKIYFRVSALLVEVLSGFREENLTLEDRGTDFFLQKIFAKETEEKKLIDFSTRVNVPLIAVGAPVKAYFPQIAERLNAPLRLPEAAEVANAVGTVSGKVIERIQVTVKPGEHGGYLVYIPGGREGFLEMEEAVQYGRKIGRENVYKKAKDSGASDIEIIEHREDKFTNLYGFVPEGEEEQIRLFIETIIEFSAVGRPWGEGN